MSDLSWLNPTPHTIAVYASQPLSPAATQPSLPSGRYPLLGPDFHRLDRTSLRLAHLFITFSRTAWSPRACALFRGLAPTENDFVPATLRTVHRKFRRQA